MKISKRQTFLLDGSVYQYRISATALKRYEDSSGRTVTNALPLTQVVRLLFHVALMLPGSVNEEQMVQLYRKGLLRTRKTKGEYSLRGFRSLATAARKKLIGAVNSV